MAVGMGLQTQRLRLLRARRLGPWAPEVRASGPRSGALAAVGARPPPSLSRLTRVNLDLAYRSRTEAALLRVAFHGHSIARLTVRGGALFLMGALASIPLLPLMAALVGLGGFVLLTLAAVAQTASVVAQIPVSATRALRIQRWSTPSAASSDGGRVRARGRVTALRTIPALDGRAAVFVTVRATRHGRGTELHKGQDFLLDDGKGRPTRVQVAHALFLDRPLRLFGSWHSPPLETFRWIPSGTTPIDLQESALFDGDEVEVVGRAETVVDPSVTDRLGRDTPLSRVLSGTADEPLLIERVG